MKTSLMVAIFVCKKLLQYPVGAYMIMILCVLITGLLMDIDEYPYSQKIIDSNYYISSSKISLYKEDVLAEQRLSQWREVYNMVNNAHDREVVKRMIQIAFFDYDSGVLPPNLRNFLDSIRTGG
jgi:hypothetical protein